MFKSACIAAVALAGITVSTAPAKADASNCLDWNGPYCEFAHKVRHHGYRLPIVWAQPAPVWYPWPPIYQTPPWNPQVTYPTQPTYPAIWNTTGTCRIVSTHGCRFRTPYYGYGH